MDFPSTELGEPAAANGSSALPRYRRVAGLAPEMVLTERDFAVLEDVWRCGLLTTSQIEMLRLADPEAGHRFVSRLTLTRRLKLLFHHRYLRRIARPQAQGSLEPVYVLDTEGARVLSLRHGEVKARVPSRLPKAVALDHLLGTVQMRVALAAAGHFSEEAKALGLGLVDWLPGEKVRFKVSLEGAGQRRQNVAIIPDAGIVLRAERYRHYAFLEVDRGTEPQRTLAEKARAYAAYWQDGGFARDFSLPVQMGFWVLFVAPGAKREQTIWKAVSGIDGPKTMFRVSQAGNVTPERLAEPAWLEGEAGQACRFWRLPD
jgi:hypothetical protein